MLDLKNINALSIIKESKKKGYKIYLESGKLKLKKNASSIIDSNFIELIKVNSKLLISFLETRSF